MIDLSIDVQGLAGLRSVLVDIPEAIRVGTSDAAKTLRNLALGGSPVGKSGDFKRSWSDVVYEDGGFSFATTAPQSIVLEEGGYSGVGPRTVVTGEGIFSRQAPEGILAPLLADENVLNKVIEVITAELEKRIAHA